MASIDPIDQIAGGSPRSHRSNFYIYVAKTKCKDWAFLIADLRFPNGMSATEPAEFSDDSVGYT